MLSRGFVLTSLVVLTLGCSAAAPPVSPPTEDEARLTQGLLARPDRQGDDVLLSPFFEVQVTADQGGARLSVHLRNAAAVAFRNLKIVIKDNPTTSLLTPGQHFQLGANGYTAVEVEPSTLAPGEAAVVLLAFDGPVELEDLRMWMTGRRV